MSVKLPKNDLFWLSLSAVLVLALVFFWFAIRPAQIRTKCQPVAEEEAREILQQRIDMGDNPVNNRKILEQGLFLRKDYDEQYKRCLQLKGL